MIRALAVIAIVGVVLSIASLVALTALGGSQASPETTDAGQDAAAFDLVVPDFTLTDQNGDPADATIFDGHWTVLDFMFTSCPIYCPGMTNVMRHVQDQTEGTGLRFVSISIDGGHDTPEALTAYANTYNADLSRWSFLTGPKDVVWPIVRDGMHFYVGLSDTQSLVRDGKTEASLDHPTRLILVGPDRTVAGMYHYDDPADVQRLIDDATRFTQTKPPAPTAAP